MRESWPEDFEELFNLYVRANVEPDISPSELFPHLLKLHSSRSRANQIAIARAFADARC